MGSVPYWTLQYPEPVNPDRKVQLTVALFGELISSTFTTRRLLVVSVKKKKDNSYSPHKHVDSFMFFVLCLLVPSLYRQTFHLLAVY